MATRLFGISPGETEFSIAEGVGSAVAADKVELTVDLGTTAVTEGATTRAIKKQEVLDALDKLKNHITKSNWPPA